MQAPVPLGNDNEHDEDAAEIELSELSFDTDDLLEGQVNDATRIVTGLNASREILRLFKGAFL